MENTNLKKTALYEVHEEHGAKFVPFVGWAMPVQYSGVIAEHKAVRSAAGLFDVSHMGEIFAEGAEAEAALNYMTCNNVAKLSDGKAQYNAITNHQGGIVDDIIIYRFSQHKYLICVNASNIEKDFDWFVKNNKFDVEFSNKSSDYAQIAIQGPQALSIFSKATGKNVEEIAYFHFRDFELFDTAVIVARTGYTGEDGVEVFLPKAHAVKLWRALMEAGEAQGLLPCGLGARDALRLEACYPLYGHELRDDFSAIESGLGWIVKLKKGDFIGREIIEKHKTEGAPRRLVGFFVDDSGIVREGTKLYSTEDKEIGLVTSGTKTPTLDRALGLAMVDAAYAKPDTQILAEVRARKLKCHVVKTPFYKRS